MRMRPIARWFRGLEGLPRAAPLWQEERGEIGPEDLSTNLIVEDDVLGGRERGTDGRGAQQVFLRLRNRIPAPPPFSSINSIPAASRAFELGLVSIVTR
jgi:hypothetical protein